MLLQAAWTSTGVQDFELAAAGGKKVVEINGQRILLATVDGTVKAVSNKCSHLGLPLVGKTAMFNGEVANGCVTCPAHGTKFDLTTGAPVGEWCPKMPSLPLVSRRPAPASCMLAPAPCLSPFMTSRMGWQWREMAAGDGSWR